MLYIIRVKGVHTKRINGFLDAKFADMQLFKLFSVLLLLRNMPPWQFLRLPILSAENTLLKYSQQTEQVISKQLSHAEDVRISFFVTAFAF